MFLSRIPLASTAIGAIVAVTVGAGAVITAASAADVEVVREYREVPGAGVFTTCADGSDVTFTWLSYRDYTTWFRDGVAVREHRHLTFDGTLTRGSESLGYTGVGTVTRTSSPATSGSPAATSASTFLPVAPWSEPASGPTATSSRAPATAS